MLVTLDYGIPKNFLDKIIPYLSGMSLSDIDILLSRISRNTFEDFEEYIEECRRLSFKTFFKITRDILMENMSRRVRYVYIRY